jgi:hypothetical protein
MNLIDRSLSLLAIAALGATEAVAQDPVPTRIRVDAYGAASGTPVPIGLQIALAAARGPTALEVSGGYPGELAALILGTRAAAVTLPPDVLLLVDPAVVVPGSYDATGRFAVPVVLTERAFIGATLFAQGLQWIQDGPQKPAVTGLQLTNGLALGYVAGNAQPPLSYSGPDLLATPIVGSVNGNRETFAVLNQVTVPTTGWSLRLEGVDSEGDTTVLYLVLESPAPHDMVMPVIRTERLLVPLASWPQPTLRVRIEQRTPGLPSPPVFQLAAVIETVF